MGLLLPNKWDHLCYSIYVVLYYVDSNIDYQEWMLSKRTLTLVQKIYGQLNKSYASSEDDQRIAG